MKTKPTVPTYKPNGWLLGTPVERITPKSEWLLELERRQSGILEASSDIEKAGYAPVDLENKFPLFED